MKLLRVKASHFKNCADDFIIDLTPKARKSTEDKEYELQEVAQVQAVSGYGDDCQENGKFLQNFCLKTFF